MHARILVAIAAVLFIAGCGSTKVVTVVRTQTRTVGLTALSGRTLQLPPARTGNQCSVSHDTAEIIFFSQTDVVKGLCQDQIQTGDWKAGYESSSAKPELLFCYLRSANGAVAASVFDLRGGAIGRETCNKLTAHGDWVTAEAGAAT